MFDYIGKLKSKGIRILPLEEYVNSSTKIKHKCICGNEWFTSPGIVLKGSTCGCSRFKNIKDYNKKAKSLGIIPLEEYKNKTAKIKHKCTCGNEWHVSPSEVLKGRKCSKCQFGKNKSSMKEYVKKLKERNISVEPLGEYVNSYTKIKHKCTCGNEWMVAPNQVLKGSLCSCRRYKQGPTRFKGYKTILYYVKVDNLFKIGITKFDKRFKTIEDNVLKKRFQNDINKGVNIELLKTKIYEDGEIAYNKEQQIINEFSDFLYHGNDYDDFVGKTELFTKDLR